ncbi:MAG: cell division protein FtsQ/DivIB [Porticoccaceae bacterium]
MARQNRRGANRSQPEVSSSDGLMEKLSRLIMLALFVTVLYGGKLVFDQLDKPLTQVMVGGDFNYMQRQDLAQLVSAEMEGGFLTVDLNHLREVLQDHAWVDHVSIRRQWPSTLRVEVIEQVPIARWGEEGFLNRLGVELSIADNSTLQSLPVLRADYGTSAEMMQHYQLLTELLLPTGLKLIEMQRDHMGAWRVLTDKGVELVLGREQIGEKIKRLALVWESGLNQQVKEIKTIDLRYPNGLAVAWRDGTLADADWNTKQNAVSTVRG